MLRQGKYETSSYSIHEKDRNKTFCELEGWEGLKFYCNASFPQARIFFFNKIDVYKCAHAYMLECVFMCMFIFIWCVWIQSVLIIYRCLCIVFASSLKLMLLFRKKKSVFAGLSWPFRYMHRGENCQVKQNVASALIMQTRVVVF